MVSIPKPNSFSDSDIYLNADFTLKRGHNDQKTVCF